MEITMYEVANQITTLVRSIQSKNDLLVRKYAILLKDSTKKLFAMIQSTSTNNIVGETRFSKFQMNLIFVEVYQLMSLDSESYCFEQSNCITLLMDIFGEQSLVISDLYHQIALLRLNRGQNDIALEFAGRALLIRANKLGVLNSKTADSHLAVGIIYRNLEHFKHSRKELHICRAIREKLYGNISLEVAYCHFQLAITEACDHQYAFAYVSFWKCFRTRFSILGPKHPLTLEAEEQLLHHRSISGERFISSLELKELVRELKWQDEKTTSMQYSIFVFVSRLGDDDAITINQLRPLVSSAIQFSQISLTSLSVDDEETPASSKDKRKAREQAIDVLTLILSTTTLKPIFNQHHNETFPSTQSSFGEVNTPPLLSEIHNSDQMPNQNEFDTPIAMTNRIYHSTLEDLSGDQIALPHDEVNKNLLIELSTPQHQPQLDLAPSLDSNFGTSLLTNEEVHIKVIPASSVFETRSKQVKHKNSPNFKPKADVTDLLPFSTKLYDSSSSQGSRSIASAQRELLRRRIVDQKNGSMKKEKHDFTNLLYYQQKNNRKLLVPRRRRSTGSSVASRGSTNMWFKFTNSSAPASWDYNSLPTINFRLYNDSSWILSKDRHGKIAIILPITDKQYQSLLEMRKTTSDPVEMQNKLESILFLSSKNTAFEPDDSEQEDHPIKIEEQSTRESSEVSKKKQISETSSPRKEMSPPMPPPLPNSWPPIPFTIEDYRSKPGVDLNDSSVQKQSNGLSSPIPYKTSDIPPSPTSIATPKMKQLYLDQIAIVPEGSVWASFAGDRKSFDNMVSISTDVLFDDIEEEFGVGGKKTIKSNNAFGSPKKGADKFADLTSAISSKSRSLVKARAETPLEPQRAHNLNIMLAKFGKISINDIIKALKDFDANALGLQAVTSLTQFIPTSTEVTKVKEFVMKKKQGSVEADVREAATEQKVVGVDKSSDGANAASNTDSTEKMPPAVKKLVGINPMQSMLAELMKKKDKVKTQAESDSSEKKTNRSQETSVKVADVQSQMIEDGVSIESLLDVNIGKAEQYILLSSTVIKLEKRLQALTCCLTIHDVCQNVTSSTEIMLRAVHEMKGSSRLKFILKTFLDLANTLGKHSKSNTYSGFKLSSLSKLTQTKSNSGETVEEYVVSKLLRHYPEALDLESDFPSAEAAKGVIFSRFSGELSKMESGIEAMREILGAEQNAASQNKTIEAVGKSIDECNQLFEKAKRQLHEAIQDFKDLCMYFGEDTSNPNLDPDQLFGYLVSFVKSISNAVNSQSSKMKRKVRNEKV